MTIQELEHLCKVNGLPLSEEQLTKLTSFADLLCAKNKVVNLISRKDEENIFSKHILHSLTLLFPSVPLAGIQKNANIFDLGTGGGMPGIPVKIAQPGISLTACDSITKKIVAVKEFVSMLGLGIEAICDRAERLGTLPKYRNKYDVVITRAVAPLDELMVWSRGLLKRGGVVLALKGGNIDEERARCKSLPFVASVDEASLSINEYDEFVKEEKKIVRVRVV
jgi:16S rRNA (guanine527-N7)-methyltransferase